MLLLYVSSDDVNMLMVGRAIVIHNLIFGNVAAAHKHKYTWQCNIAT